jgi:predicted ATPase
MMFEDESFFGKKFDTEPHWKGFSESGWRSGPDIRIDNFAGMMLKNQKWMVYHFHDTGDTALVKQVQGINDNIEFAADARNLAAFLYRLKETEENSYRRIVRTIQLAAPYFEDFILRPNPLKPDSICLEWKDKNSDAPFTAAQLSDGTLRFICLATLMLQPESLMPETILIDEPELGLHPYAISLLAALIKKVSVNKQIIISTQSVELLNEFEAKDVIVTNHLEDETTFLRLDPKQLNIWLEEDYTLGDLWKRNILGGRP